MFWKRDHRVIHVLYVDADTGSAISQSMVPIEKLPDSFEADTTVHMAERGDFRVVTAEPVTAAQFRRTGELRLTLQRAKIVRLDPANVLYSLPTICDELPSPAPASTKLGKRVLQMHEDDWRHTEFVSISQLPEIERHLAAIRQIYAEHRDGVGFREIHVRKGPAKPLEPYPSACPVTPRARRHDAASTPYDTDAEGSISNVADTLSPLRSSRVTREDVVPRTKITPQPPACPPGAHSMSAKALVLPAVGPNPSRSWKTASKYRVCHDREGFLVCLD
jgi:hypothetical protein